MCLVSGLDRARKQNERCSILARRRGERRRLKPGTKGIAQVQRTRRRRVPVRHVHPECIVRQIEIFSEPFQDLCVACLHLFYGTERTCFQFRCHRVMEGRATDLSAAIRWLMTAHARSGSAFALTPPSIRLIACVVPARLLSIWLVFESRPSNKICSKILSAESE
jgi:hypothetical protein